MSHNKNIFIRPASVDDKEFILSLLPRLNEFGPPLWRDLNEMQITDGRILIDKLTGKQEGTAIFIAEDKEQCPLGFIHLQSGHDYYYKEKHGHISDIIITAQAEGRGIGSALIAHSEQWARSQGYKWLTLSVFAQNSRARQMYTNLGFGEDIMKYVKELKDPDA